MDPDHRFRFYACQRGDAGKVTPLGTRDQWALNSLMPQKEMKLSNGIEQP